MIWTLEQLFSYWDPSQKLEIEEIIMTLEASGWQDNDQREKVRKAIINNGIEIKKSFVCLKQWENDFGKKQFSWTFVCPLSNQCEHKDADLTCTIATRSHREITFFFFSFVRLGQVDNHHHFYKSKAIVHHRQPFLFSFGGNFTHKEKRTKDGTWAIWFDRLVNKKYKFKFKISCSKDKL